jgi:UDP-N-acetylglucosamine 2-epimerase
MSVKTVASIVGARPQFIKSAPVSRALASRFREVLIHTGQHYDYGMSEIFFSEMELRPPDFNLGVGGGSHGEQTGRMLIELEKVLAEVKPDCVLVYGDTNSTLAGAVVSAKGGIPLAHVEAGLRSYNRAMPEEVNRVLTDHISNFLFCPTNTAVENLVKEGIVNGVHQIGDVMYDALLYNLDMARKHSQILARLGLGKGDYALATVHRVANTDDPERMRSILGALSALSMQVVFPVHPRTRKMLLEWGLTANSNVLFIEPQGYFDILTLQENANCILTDSGGMQKEAYLLGVRCITLREETEWVETVSSGWNKLVGVDQNVICTAVETWHPLGDRPLLYGDGHAAERISGILINGLI